jgi:hypothetical protein
MTAVQDWLNIRPVDQNAIRNLMLRPLRAVWNVAEQRDRTTFTSMSAGVERC